MTDARRNQRDLGKTAFGLWCVSMAIPVLSFLIALMFSSADDSGYTGGLSPLIWPTYTAVIWAPIAMVALGMSIVAIREPLASKRFAIATVVLSGIGVLPFVAAFAFAGLTLLRL